MPRPTDVVMARSIYDDNESLPTALVISHQPDLKESLINPDMDRSNNKSTIRNNDGSDDCCDGCCDNDTLLLCCCLWCLCDN